MVCLQPWAVPGILKQAASLPTSCHVRKVSLLWLPESTGLTFYALRDNLMLTQDMMLQCDLKA